MPPIEILWPRFIFHMEVIKFEACICISEMLQKDKIKLYHMALATTIGIGEVW